LDELKDLRLDIARSENLPAYIILSDATLVEMATYLPQSLDELRLISGFGDVKLARYGRDFLVVLKSYCERKGLTSRIKQKSAKPVRKARTESKGNFGRSNDTAFTTFEMYRSGKSVAEIAAERALAPTTIEGHLAFYIYTGALPLSALVPDKKKKVIKDAVESYGAEKLSPLKEVLGDEYTYGEIKAVIAWMRKEKMI